MKNFDYQTPTRLIFGRDVVAGLPEVMRPFGRRILLTYGGGSIKRIGLYDRVKELLKDFEIFELGGIEPNPKYSTSVVEGVRICKEQQIDVILSVGGGSVLDCSKAIAGGAKYDGETWDLIIGKGQKSAILTLCERSVNFLLLARLPRGKDPEGVADKVVELLFPYRKQVHTITTDNGSEFACHQRIAQALGTTVYFADAYASWQKGAIENMNKLVRQYLPKGLDFSDVSDDFIKQVQYKINRRPRERLGFSTPKKEFFKFFL